MFSFYGSKWRAAPKYQPPQEKLIIEPFCGSASYAMLHHRSHDVWINDVDPCIFGIWTYLQKATRADILALPLDVSNVDALDEPQAVKDLIGFWFTKATPIPAKEKVGWARGGEYEIQYWSEGRRNRIAEQVEFIHDWKITNLPYDKLPNENATWFIDPPYCGVAGRAYKFDFVDYEFLGFWCKQRAGQVIVCENEGAAWLPFRSFGEFKTVREGKSIEVVWTNKEDFDMKNVTEKTCDKCNKIYKTDRGFKHLSGSCISPVVTPEKMMSAGNSLVDQIVALEKEVVALRSFKSKILAAMEDRNEDFPRR
jgi:hypothetical protein